MFMISERSEYVHRCDDDDIMENHGYNECNYNDTSGNHAPAYRDSDVHRDSAYKYNDTWINP
jgi:hypothetical protein